MAERHEGIDMQSEIVFEMRMNLEFGGKKVVKKNIFFRAIFLRPPPIDLQLSTTDSPPAGIR